MDNTNLFSGKASVYDSARVSFPKEMMDFIFDTFAAKGDVIADIGSGTGKLTELLLGGGNRVYAVEPNADMRAVAISALGGKDNFISVNGSAENTGLRSESIDIITVARAFHWFDKEKFLTEAKRILKSEGKILVITNGQDIENALLEQQYNLLCETCPSYRDSHLRGGRLIESSFVDFFSEVECYKFCNDIVRDRQSYINDMLSKSFAPSVSECCYTAYIDRLSLLFDEFAVDGKVTVQGDACLYTGKII